MYKRPDSDIFGAKQLDQPIKIKNDSFVDPNEAFKKKNDENYHNYMHKLGNVGRKNIEGNPEMTKVNEKVNFDDEYHKDRKFMDLKSSIFYEDNLTRPKTTQSSTSALKEKPLQTNDPQSHYGRKNTLKREVQSLPYNQSNIKGNASQLFDFDSKAQQPSEQKNKPTLIPHQMQWDQHDSIRYNHHKTNKITNNESNVFEKGQEAKSVEDEDDKNDRKETMKEMKSLDKKGVETDKNTNSKQKEEPKKEEKKPAQPTGDIEVRIVRGWDNKFMEGLTKYCKLYSTPMTKFELEGAGKAVIFLKRSKKWEAVTDWLTKDAKLKIRVIGN